MKSELGFYSQWSTIDISKIMKIPTIVDDSTLIDLR